MNNQLKNMYIIGYMLQTNSKLVWLYITLDKCSTNINGYNPLLNYKTQSQTIAKIIT
jgi:hypothetical protein